ncbi:MAG TPA: transglycosylase SLT domain-containing protein [Pyrinomonadaceae bacterium]|nr:transglycosylase SLT domain-containing protein [Pyrinomonadaceae bacterium]
MKLKRTILLSLALLLAVTAARAQTGKPYRQMTNEERAAFVRAEARRVARRMAGAEYEFTESFETEIRKWVEKYAARVGNQGGDRPGTGDLRFVFERGQKAAPTIAAAFKTQDVSPLIGLYIPLIESEYVNIESPNMVGALGMFQFLPKTGERFGLSRTELLDVAKSAGAAARYIAKNVGQFEGDPMKEALALLAYNRGEDKTARALALVLNDQNRRCSICALTEARAQLDRNFQEENVHYVPRFFAAAIIGENPQAFGLGQQPLSSY